MMNYVHAQAPRILQIHGAVVNENALLRGFLRYFQGNSKDGFLRFSRMDIAGAEKCLEVATEIELCNAVIVQFQRLVVDRCDEVFAGECGPRKNGASFRIFLGLGKHKRDKFFAGEGMRAVEESPIQILVQSDLSRVESGEGEVVAVLEILPIELESFRSTAARFAIPTVGKNNAADIPKKRGDTRQGYLQKRH
jgi:hypothetical protein